LGEREDVLVAQAIRALAHHPDVKDIKVVNLSFGGAVFTDEAANLESALDELDPGIAVVAAAGNDGNDNMVWPAAFAVQRKDPERLGQVISVGALDERRLIPAAAIPPRAAFSNYGPWVTAYAGGVQVLGPFVDYYETGRDDFGLRPPQHYRGWARWSGTSFAAAKVSGRIAQTAVALDKTGAEAAQLLLADAPKIDEHDAVWIRATP
jgi:subtilisin family serine protease